MGERAYLLKCDILFLTDENNVVEEYEIKNSVKVNRIIL